MNRRSKKDRRNVNVRVLTDATERRKKFDRRDDGVKLMELKVGDEAFTKIFDQFVSKKDKKPDQ